MALGLAPSLRSDRTRPFPSLRSTLTALTLAAFAAACGDSGQVLPPTGLAISPPTATVAAGLTVQLTALALAAVNGHALEGELESFGERPAEPGVVVALDRVQRPLGLQTIKQAVHGDVAGMDHHVALAHQAPRGRGQVARSAGEMGVGKHGDPHRSRMPDGTRAGARLCSAGL